jgi:hypothetical protein
VAGVGQFMAGVLAVTAIACGVDEPLSASGETGDELRILYVGDSLAANSRNTVKSSIEATGRATVFESIFPGVALCDFLANRPSILPPPMGLTPMVERVKPQLIILQFWGNRSTPCMGEIGSIEASVDRYLSDGLAAVEEIEAAAEGAGIARPKLLWVLQGPESKPEWHDRTRRLNEHYAFLAEQYGDRTSDAGWEVSMANSPDGDFPEARYTWTQYLPCTDLEKQIGLCTHPHKDGGVTQLHADNDALHFCLADQFLYFCLTPSPGAIRYGLRIAEDAKEWLGL